MPVLFILFMLTLRNKNQGTSLEPPRRRSMKVAVQGARPGGAGGEGRSERLARERLARAVWRLARPSHVASSTQQHASGSSTAKIPLHHLREARQGPKDPPSAAKYDHREHRRTPHVHLGTQRKRILGLRHGGHDDWKRSVGRRSPNNVEDA